MKKVFIYAYNLELGGIERSLIGLLESFDKDEYLVDLFLAKQEGALLSDIPDTVNLLPIEKRYQAFGIPLKNAIKEGFFYESLMRIVAKAVNKALRILKKDNTISIESFIYHKFIISRMKGQESEYDLAVSFAMPYFYVLNKVHAKVKIGFIHTDYSRVNINFLFIRKMFEKINFIASVSESVRRALLNSITIDPKKTLVIENIMPMKSISRSSNDEQRDMLDDGSVRLLSIGRFGEAKNFDNVPEICKLIREQGLNVKWFLIGFGADEQLIKSKITEFHMEEYVIILGKKENPYPYIKACDLYVQPSRYEGKCVAVREAQMLCKPVVITNFATSASQLEDGKDGIVVPMDNQGCAEGIIALLNNKKLISDLIQTCSIRDYSNHSEINKVYEMMNLWKS